MLGAAEGSDSPGTAAEKRRFLLLHNGEIFHQLEEKMFSMPFFCPFSSQVAPLPAGSSPPVPLQGLAPGFWPPQGRARAGAEEGEEKGKDRPGFLLAAE